MTRRKLIVWAGAFAFAGVLMYYAGGCVQPRPPARSIESDKVFIAFYGYGGRSFSAGLDTITSDFGSNGWDARCYPYTSVDQALEAVLQTPRARIAIAGHSFGARAAVELAQRLRDRNIPVASLLLLDSSEPSRPNGDFTTARALTIPIPDNVRRATIYCLPGTPILGVTPCPRAHWGAATLVSTPPPPAGANHLTIDDDPAIRAAIEEVAR